MAMVSQLYQLGLLTVVFGGFVSLTATGSFGNIGFVTMLVGFVLGCIGILYGGIPDR
ncbi:hypothetical protein [Haloarchaeobius sp. TZWWS8]|uniref:hypothetical protein n=1 Tax=Haloarchaeobius sp. TZWWS8 TaxID=3446121 RepID=UPI003EBC4506